MHRRLTSCALAVVVLMSCSTAVVSAHGGDKADQAAGSVTRVAPPVQGEVQTRATKKPDGSYSTKSAHTTTSAPANSRGKLAFASAETSKTLTIGLPTEVAQADAVLSSDGSVVYASDSASSSTVVQAFTNGVRISTTLASREAGTSFTYPLDLKKGSHIDIQDNGGVLIIGPDGSLLGGLLTPWAKDRNGASVPTHYAVHGNSVVQVIDGDPAVMAYPVIADPYWFQDLIAGSWWEVTYTYNGRQGWTDHVFPTVWAMQNPGNPLVAIFGWDELISKDTHHYINTNVDGMSDQYQCHQILWGGIVKIIISGSPAYNLDEYRVHEGLAQTMVDKCNPRHAW